MAMFVCSDIDFSPLFTSRASVVEIKNFQTVRQKFIQTQKLCFYQILFAKQEKTREKRLNFSCVFFV